MPHRRTRQGLSSLRQKIRARAPLARTVRRLQRARRRVVFTNGCFDVLHAGHVSLLEQARRHGDALIVAINSDRSTRVLKGPGRPLVPQRDRALLLAALRSVDYVTIFHEATPRNLVARLKPDVLIKGADWGAKDIVGRDVVERYGGRVIRVKLVKGRSTTSLLRRIRAGR